MTCAQHLDFKAANDYVSVGIVGYGVVGQAMEEALLAADFDVLVHDVIPEKSKNSLRDVVARSKLIFVCVPTPDASMQTVKDTIHDIDELNQIYSNWNPVVLIKSTVLPQTTETLQAMYPTLRLGCCPEFLRQKYAKSDACNPSRIVVGLCNVDDERDVKPIIEELDCADVIYTTPVNAELIKMLSNALLSTKVAYANLIASLCSVYVGDAETVYRGIIGDSRFSASHLDPSGGRMGVDSPCLPKDLKALICCCEGDNQKFLELVYRLAVKL